MEKVRRDTNFIVLGLVLYTLLRYVIFALEPLARGDAELLQTLTMLASLNDTSLYATFFIS